MAENDGNGVVKKVPVWITSDGSLFLTEDDAKKYQEVQDGKNKEAQVFREGQKYLSTGANNLTKVNGYYRMVNGEFFGTNNVYDALTSLVIDTPESTLKLIKSVDGGG